MSYTKREWATGNVVGAVDLNRMEQGIEDAGSSGSGEVLVVTETKGILDKTWQEIYDAFPNCYILANGKHIITEVSDGDYHIRFANGSGFKYLAATSADGYPTEQIK